MIVEAFDMLFAELPRKGPAHQEEATAYAATPVLEKEPEVILAGKLHCLVDQEMVTTIDETR